jgi:FixJ family two-component response regulator
VSKLTPVVFVVDDDVSIRESVEALIETAGLRAKSFATAAEFLEACRDASPSCLVLDVSLPGLSGLDLQQRLGDQRDLPIIFITGHGDIPMSVQAMKAGAIEFLTKPFNGEVLLSTIRRAIESSSSAIGRESELEQLRRGYGSLSPRERQVMAHVVAGRLNKQVGSELGISEVTVKAHRGQVMRKMNAASLADLVRMAAALDLPAAPVRGVPQTVAADKGTLA